MKSQTELETYLNELVNQKKIKSWIGIVNPEKYKIYFNNGGTLTTYADMVEQRLKERGIE